MLLWCIDAFNRTISGKRLLNRSGSVIPMMVPAVIASLGLAGFAIEFSRIGNSRSQLQAALDAAALAAARDRGSDATALTIFARPYADANLQSIGSVSLSTFNVNLLDSNTTVEVTGSVQLPLLLGGLFGMSAIEIEERSVARIEIRPTRVSLVLDNTGSTNNNGAIEGIRDAARVLVDTLLEDASEDDDVLVGIVPYVTTVNIRNEEFDMAWMDVNGLSASHGIAFDESAGPVNHFDLFNALEAIDPRAGWKGCVEARHAPFDVTADPPNPGNPNSLFIPYFWPDEPDAPHSLNTNSQWRNPTSNNLRANYANDFFDLGVSNTLDGGFARNGWLQGPGAAIQNQRQAILRDASRYLNPANQAQIAATLRIDDDPRSNTLPAIIGYPINIGDAHTLGPNQSCPTPITPMTDDLDRLRTEISGMIGWNGSGTNSAIGMNWGWMQLTPQAPFPVPPARNSDNELQRIMVLMTDGANVAVSAVTPNISQYSGYGYVDQGRLGTTNINQTVTRLDNLLLQMCTSAKNDGIVIYTVTFAASSTLQNIYRQCATTPTHFFNAPNAATLVNVFGQIAREISDLRLAE